MVTCELCGKQVKTAQALRGHKTFIHGITGSNTQQPVARVATEQQVSLLEDRLQQLERVTGLRESDLDFSLSDTEPLTDRLTNVTEQVTKLRDTVSKLSDIVSKLSEDVELAKADKVMVGELNHKLKEAHNSLATVVNNHRDIFNNNFAVLGSRIDKVQKMVEDLGEGLSIIRTKLTTHGHDNLKPVLELVAKVGNLERALGTMQSQVEHLALVVERKSTDDTERIRLTDGREHTFRVYRGKRGLSKPHRVSVDLFLGDKYVDLAEPED
jgi:Mg2+ and Co2+ transporter CorA